MYELWVTIVKPHTLAVFLFLYKVVNTVVPSAISSMFVFNRDVHDHDTRQANKFMLTLFIVISALSVSAIKLQHCTTALMASTTMYHINVSST